MLSWMQKAYNIPINAQIEVLSTGFLLKPHLFEAFVGQYINHIDLILDIKVTDVLRSSIQQPLIAETISNSNTYIKQEENYEHLDIDDGEKDEEEFLMSSDLQTQSPTQSCSYKKQNVYQHFPTKDEILKLPEIHELVKFPKMANQYLSQIAQTIVKYVVNKESNRKLSREQILQLAEMIADIIPGLNKGEMQLKLFETYNNYMNSSSECATSSTSRFAYYLNDPSDSDSQELYAQCDSTNSARKLPSSQDMCQMPEIRRLLRLRKLENKHRVKIAKSIIAYIQFPNPETTLTREDFMELAKSIAEVFPLEIPETYYVPSIKKQIQKGKLYDAYNQSRTRLRAAGIIKRRHKFDTDQHSVEKSSSSEEEQVDDFDTKELELLNPSKNESWDTVLTTWKKSHRYRQNQLKTRNMQPTLYIVEYSILLNAKWHELIEIDFNMLYPKAKDIYNWKNYCDKVMDRARNVRDNCIKDIFKNIEDAERNGDENAKLAIALLLIPYLLPQSRKQRRQEVQECFVTHTQTDPFETPNEKRSKSESDPNIYFIGNSEQVISHAYVDIVGLRIKFDNPLRAVEVCFKCFHTMNMRYPKSCFNVWVLIQQLIFNLIKKNEPVAPGITTLINDVKNEGTISDVTAEDDTNVYRLNLTY
ncbi:uncharacterized protein LOC142232263 isoform X2 [Haematobia irritans]|uniref:uncharacterized protein LOC142232263 isoform X2 n=1 Tax=Haematobia irritans TaxID=7368 RepID=UPI003F50AF6F